MKYFNRHECMNTETLRSIGESTTGIFLIEGVSSFGGVSNMLYGLYDGFDYADQIRTHNEMVIIKEQNPEMYHKIMNICDEVDSYPKQDRDVTIH